MTRQAEAAESLAELFLDEQQAAQANEIGALIARAGGAREAVGVLAEIERPRGRSIGDVARLPARAAAAATSRMKAKPADPAALASHGAEHALRRLAELPSPSPSFAGVHTSSRLRQGGGE